ncbi:MULTISPECIES: ABC transporter ATP-binding protein [Micrococcaceae]|uniref:ABC transporter ATP-binding protein n=1 Tax=Micrococcaceae TaxID=1268 RepID=UPI000CFB63B5|nr:MULTISPECIES: dipeptide ABC transporter ATP-binding protein [unclassified Arthrobacter]PQZ88272.1 dipeptide/oligopeptide/nickel ABC transporter ATP-binding protein [Arthrobacter sp. MYb222]PRB76814.1 dipeptide/oligopeptide/nickel ABC transporter ATP-binding protein [Arthrobacter sp. MYb214]TDU30309.1 oligopeptide transport system ATP-binding protein [Arthrobacter sp. JUb115]
MLSPQTLPETATPDAAPLMEMRGVTRHYPVARSLPIGPRKVVKALDGVDLQVQQGKTLGIIGESGCGKSTMARVLSGLEKPTAGQVLFEGHDINALRGAERAQMRRNIQLIFQDPYASLNPRMTIEQILSEPFEIHPDIAKRGSRRANLGEMMELVGLNPDHLGRYPHNFSGGQQQRIGIARGIALNPKVLICDEAVSALDVSVRAQVVNLLDSLQRELGLSYVFIAHDLQIVRHISDSVATMYLGRVIETGSYAQVYDASAHPYTQALLSAAPELRQDPAHARQLIMLQGDPPSPIDPPSGCRFHTRCPVARPDCATSEPELDPVADGHRARCFYPGPISTELSQGD